jgi:hypothetical protein
VMCPTAAFSMHGDLLHTNVIVVFRNGNILKSDSVPASGHQRNPSLSSESLLIPG